MCFGCPIYGIPFGFRDTIESTSFAIHLSCNIAKSEFLILSELFTCPIEFQPIDQSYSIILQLMDFKSSFSEQLSKSDLRSTLLLPRLSTNEAASSTCVFMSHSKSKAKYLSRILF